MIGKHNNILARTDIDMPKNSSEKGFNFRSFISILQEKGDLVHIKKKVDPQFELPAMLWKLQQRGKAAFFEHVKGSPFSLAGGLLLGMERLGLALGITPTKEFVSLQDTGYLDAAFAEPLSYIKVQTGPVTEVMQIGRDIDLTKLPVPTFYEHDSGPFITGGIGIVRNPDTATLNAGIYRILVLGKDSITVNAGANSDLAQIYKTAHDRKEKLSIAVAIGVSPALLVASASKPPGTISEIDVAGALRGKPLEMVKCTTNDLCVPAEAEIVIEGEVVFTENVNNTLGEAGGYYRSNTNPLIKVTAVSHRHDAIFYAIHAGPSIEHLTLGAFSLIKLTSSFITELKQRFPVIKKAHVYAIGDWLHLAIALDKKEDNEALQLIREVFNMPSDRYAIKTFIKRIVVVDTDIDIYNNNDIEWTIWNRVDDADNIFIVPSVRGSSRQPSVRHDKSIRVGIDATRLLKNGNTLKKVRNPLLEDIIVEHYL